MNAGDIIVGDGGMTFCLEKRGYVKAGPWTPECTVESPEAGKYPDSDPGKGHNHHHYLGKAAPYPSPESNFGFVVFFTKLRRGRGKSKNVAG